MAPRRGTDGGTGGRSQPIRAAERVVTRIRESARSPVRAEAFHGLAERGSSSPLGATPASEGTNFSVFSCTPRGSSCCCSTASDDARAARVDPNRSRDQPHLPLLARVRARREGRTALRLSRGRARPTRRRACASIPTRSCSTRTAAAWPSPTSYNRDAAGEPGRQRATAMKSVVVDPSAYDWEGDAPLRRPSAQTIIYEMHVRGFTRHPQLRRRRGDARHVSPA